MTIRALKHFVPIVVAVLLTVVGWQLLNDARQARAEAELAWLAVDSGSVKLAAERIDKKRYQDLLAFAEKVGGRPVAGVRIPIPMWDTVYVHDTLPTVTAPDGTRTASFTDSSESVVVRADVTAPPCCAPLQARLQVTLPADTPTIGFVQVGSKTVVRAKWRGREVSLDAPFYTPVKPPRVQSFIEVLGDPETATVRGGSSLRVFGGWSAVAAVGQRFAPGERTQVGAGVRYTF